MKDVVAGDPANSYLIQKLQGNMGQYLDPQSSSQAQTDFNTIVTWIQQGANK